MNRILHFSDFINESQIGLTRSIGLGDSGDAVYKIQQRLIDLKLLKIPAPTGYFGPNTKKAVITFQGKNPPLVPDGVVGKETGPRLMIGAVPVNPNPPIKNKNIIVSDSLINRNIVFDPTRETTPFTVKEDGCAKFVSDSLSDLGIPRQNHAWFSRAFNEDKIEFTVFKNFNESILKDMSEIFSFINKDPEEGVAESKVKNLLIKLTPNQNQLKSKLAVNDIVGLYYDDSHNYTKAFFEAATGYDKMGSKTKITNTYFRRSDNDKPWTPNDLGKDIKFVPGNTLKSGGGFTFNTHLGYVGAIAGGEPIIFHSIDKTVIATPFSKMKNIKILWIKSGTVDNTGKVINYKTTSWDKMKKSFS